MDSDYQEFEALNERTVHTTFLVFVGCFYSRWTFGVLSAYLVQRTT